MGIYINGMDIPQEGRITIQIGADGAVYTVTSCKITAEKYEKEYHVIEVPEPYGRLIDADEFLKRAIGTKCFRDDFALMLEELVGESTTIIPASKEGM